MSAEELDGPGAIVSHAEVLEAWQDGARRPVDIARELGVSSSTASRLLANLRRAGLLS